MNSRMRNLLPTAINGNNIRLNWLHRKLHLAKHLKLIVTNMFSMMRKMCRLSWIAHCQEPHPQSDVNLNSNSKKQNNESLPLTQFVKVFLSTLIVNNLFKLSTIIRFSLLSAKRGPEKPLRYLNSFMKQDIQKMGNKLDVRSHDELLQ